MRIIETPLPGAHLVALQTSSDNRGSFVKVFQEKVYADLGLSCRFSEEFYSRSKARVIRGMHFQVPPHDLSKLVYCIKGRVLDVLLDLRRSQESYGTCAAVSLAESDAKALFIPSGVAHGFLAIEDDSVLVYKTSKVYAAAHDTGVRWDSFGFDWGIADPILSARDAGFVKLKDFASPFC